MLDKIKSFLLGTFAILFWFFIIVFTDKHFQIKDYETRKWCNDNAELIAIIVGIIFYSIVIYLYEKDKNGK